MNFYPFHIGDYISHTHHLSDAEDLAYRRMIDLYYQQEKGFLSPEWVARKIKSNPETVKGILHEFFEHNDELGFWYNTRADEEIAKYHAIQAGGRKGAAIRWNKGSDSPPIAPPNASPMQTKTNTKTITKTINKNTIAKPEGLADLLWNDFLILRRSKKLPVTQTAFEGIAREAKKANKTLAEVIQICCERGWGGFKESWLQVESLKTQDKPNQRWDSTLEGVMNRGRELGILPKPGETEGQYRERVKQG
jgi:uncharacterized protein YdaU (DUF1376 family)